MTTPNSKSIDSSKTVPKSKKKNSLSTLMLLPEYKREVFKKYMDKSGMMDIIAKSMIALKDKFEIPDPQAQPADAVKFIKDMMLSEVPRNEEKEEIRSLIAAATERLNILLAENETLKAQLKSIESVKLTSTETIKAANNNVSIGEESVTSFQFPEPLPSENNFDSLQLGLDNEELESEEHEQKDHQNEALEQQLDVDIDQKQPSTKVSVKDNTSLQKLDESGEIAMNDEDDEEE